MKFNIAVRNFVFYLLFGLLVCQLSCKKDNNEENPTGSGTACPDIPTITYGGQTYHTVLIGDQCWMKENLNIGSMIPGRYKQTDNDTIEKYCYDNDEANCDKYGGLYQWGEMMQYVSNQGIQGICPTGWHIPSDEEWEILEGTVDSQYGVGHSMWDNTGVRGFDAGKKLKTTSGWYNNGNGTDDDGFSALPGARRSNFYTFRYLGEYAYFWSSSEFDYNNAMFRALEYQKDGVIRSLEPKVYGFSVRCLKD